MADQIFSIDGRAIGPEHPPYVVAEISANHNGDIKRAFEIMESAKEAGADAIKLQTYTADTITLDHDGPGFLIESGPWKGRTLHDLYREASTPWEWHEDLFAKGRELGITVFSSPFDHGAVDFLETLDAPAYKIASFEAVDVALIERVAQTGKPLIISTGMADFDEIETAVTAAGTGPGGLVLLHCVSAYPAPAAVYNLRTIPHMAQAFHVPVGLSDHTIGEAVATAAVALGAIMVEKHVTLRRADGGPDSGFSAEPGEFAQLCQAVRTVWESLGAAHYERSAAEQENAIFRRSLYAVSDIAAGTELTEQNVRSIRPGFGLPPKELVNVLGRRAAKPIARGTPLHWDLLEP